MPGFAILPAAITMVAGPQIISAVVLATSREPGRNSIAYIMGVLGAVLLGTAVAIGVLTFASGFAKGLENVGGAKWLTYFLVALLGLFAIRSFRTRKTSEPPKWLTGLQEAEPKAALKLGFVLFLVMPTDVLMMFSVGMYITQKHLSLVSGVPFVALTMLFISAPLLIYLLFRERAERALPGIRDWMNTYSWAINVGICLYFMHSLLAG